MQVEIVAFERRKVDIFIGYRLNSAVVYASVPTHLNDDEAKQKGYEQVRKALEYEQTRDIPSFTMPDEVDEDGNVIPFETFTPAEPVVKSIEIHGESHIAFTDDSPSKTVEFVASAIDQYGDPIETSYEWTGADNGVLILDNVDGSYEVSAEAGDVTASIKVDVSAYRAPEPTEVDLLAEYVVDVDFRVAMLELGF